MDINKKSLIVAIAGKPNVGKSTLFNSILNNDIAIISHKPQTTRKKLEVLLEMDDCSILFIDTPGFHSPKNKLDLFLNGEVKGALKSANVACFIFDITRDFDIEDENILKHIYNFDIENKILLINKSEISTQNNIDNKVESICAKYKFDHVVQISALHKINIDKLLNILKPYASIENDISFYREPPEEFIVSEIIRERCIFLLKKELPYAVGIIINEFKYDKSIKRLTIAADIVIEKESQKPILIGKGGSMIKRIGVESRKKLLSIYDCSVELNLFVKVEKSWRDSDFLITEMGYKK